MKPIWTVKSNSCGYMLYRDGKPRGGAGTLGTATQTAGGRTRHWAHRRADVKMFHETGMRECARLNRMEETDDQAPT